LRGARGGFYRVEEEGEGRPRRWGEVGGRRPLMAQRASVGRQFWEGKR
jgi:hypothetical protein